MPTIVEEIESSSKWIADILRQSGYNADFSPESLWEIDRFFYEQSFNGKAKPGGLLSKDLRKRVFALGAYIGEVIRAYVGGKWVGDDNDPEADFNVELHFDESIIWPTQRAGKRFRNGSEDDIGPYALALGIQIGPRPNKPFHPWIPKPWWKFW